MSKRIFTKVFRGAISAETQIPEEVGAVHSWLVQYDSIEVIAAQASLWSYLPSENDGFTNASVELSQVGVVGQEGAILSVAASEGWNTTPAGIMAANGHMAIVFPSGYAVPVKEEGYLYINTTSLGKSAGVSQYRYEVIVHYTKKSVR